MFFNSDFWPLFWGILGAGFAVTAMVSLLVASIRLPRVHRRATTKRPRSVCWWADVSSHPMARSPWHVLGRPARISHPPGV
jgi:hypothetical protein